MARLMMLVFDASLYQIDFFQFLSFIIPPTFSALPSFGWDTKTMWWLGDFAAIVRGYPLVESSHDVLNVMYGHADNVFSLLLRGLPVGHCCFYGFLVQVLHRALYLLYDGLERLVCVLFVCKQLL